MSRAMIVFMISDVPPKIGWTRLSHQSSHNRGGERRTGVPAVQGGLHLISASRGARGAIWAAITRHGIVSPRGNSPVRGVTPTMTPNQQPRISQPSTRMSTPIEFIAAQLPQVLVMHGVGDVGQVGSCSGEPSRGNQDRALRARAAPWRGGRDPV